MGKPARPKSAKTPATADRRCLWCGKPLPEPTKVASEEYVVVGGLRNVSEYYCTGMRCRELSLARRISQQKPLARPSELAKLQAEKQARGCYPRQPNLLQPAPNCRAESKPHRIGLRRNSETNALRSRAASGNMDGGAASSVIPTRMMIEGFTRSS